MFHQGSLAHNRRNVNRAGIKLKARKSTLVNVAGIALSIIVNMTNSDGKGFCGGSCARVKLGRLTPCRSGACLHCACVAPAVLNESPLPGQYPPSTNPQRPRTGSAHPDTVYLA